MKKILLAIPFTLLLIHFAYQSDGPNTWTPTITSIGAVWQGCIVINPSNQQIMYAASFTTGIWKSTNGGLNWTQSNGSMTNLTMQALAISKSNPSVLYCGTSQNGANNGVYKSTDAAATWTQINTGITQVPIAIQGIDISPTDPNVAYVCVWDGSTTVNASVGLFKTTNGGTLWAPCNTGMGANKNMLCVLVNPLNANTVYAGTSFLQNPSTGPTFVYKSYNAGTSWASFSTGLPALTTTTDAIRMLSMSTIDTNRVLAGLFFNTSDGGPYFTTNGGTSWTKITTGFNVTLFPGSLIRSVLIRPGSNTEFYAGGDATTQQPGGVWKTTNAGANWFSFNTGSMLSTYPVRALAFRTTADSTLFAGVGGATGSGFGIYEYSYGPLGISDPNEIPKEFRLLQNYPNPFNPATKIVYQLPRASYVKLSVYDASGQLVKMLVDGYQTQLNNTIDFSGEGLSSGVYFYKMSAGDFTDVKKMILVK